jgi:hypothetical protein
MNESSLQRTSIFALVFFVLGIGGIIGALIQPQSGILFVVEMVGPGLFCVIALSFFSVYFVHKKKHKRLESEYTSALSNHATPRPFPNEVLKDSWINRDEIILIMSILFLVAGMARFVLAFPYTGSTFTFVGSIVITSLYCGMALLFFAIYLGNKKKRKSQESMNEEAHPRQAARPGPQPKEIQEK